AVFPIDDRLNRRSKKCYQSPIQLSVLIHCATKNNQFTEDISIVKMVRVNRFVARVIIFTRCVIVALELCDPLSCSGA
uniref:Uncharacterized protein n=1 Tax=Romanomermis culicivorax TaxID=13658 RepID=A0A915INH6_ROMCU